jgi:DNA-binding MarR family transcriptional regulator
MALASQIVAQTCIATRSRIAARTLSRIYDDALRPLDLKITQFAVLVAASMSNGKLTISELADELALERSSLSRSLDPLERRGLVTIGPETQHRARHVGITDEGRALLTEAMPLWDGAQSRIKLRLGTQWDGALDALRRLADTS